MLTLQLGSQSIESPTSATLKSAYPITFTPPQGQEGGALQLPPQGPHTCVAVDVGVYLPLEAADAADGSAVAAQVRVRLFLFCFSISLFFSFLFCFLFLI